MSRLRTNALMVATSAITNFTTSRESAPRWRSGNRACSAMPRRAAPTVQAQTSAEKINGLICFHIVSYRIGSAPSDALAALCTSFPALHIMLGPPGGGAPDRVGPVECGRDLGP